MESRENSSLQDELTWMMIDGYQRAGEETGYWGKRYLRSINRDGGLATAKRMLTPRTKGQRKGLDTLLEAGRADLTTEAIILEPRLKPLFTAAELAEATRRLHRYRLETARPQSSRSRIRYPPRITRESRRLLAVSKRVAIALRQECANSQLRIRLPTRTAVSWTDGWFATIGDLGKGRARLEIWLDRYSGHRTRMLWAGFHSERGRSLSKLTERARKRLWPRRVITNKDVTIGNYWRLTSRLTRFEFNVPIFEQYDSGDTFFGLFEANRSPSRRSDGDFLARATAFFGDVARALPHAAGESTDRDIYPQLENRKLVVRHLVREHSRLLATECKIRDNYTCQVCGICFKQRYGDLGKGVIEAHHRVPLSQLRQRVRTRLRDLTSVCANCHRMLHNLKGEKNDIPQLKGIVHRHHR
jgi:5-methylcytosine-specific restriction endonuclease McrA